MLLFPSQVSAPCASLIKSHNYNHSLWMLQKFANAVIEIQVFLPYTVNREFFVVKIFSQAVLATKITHTKFRCMCIINIITVRGKGSLSTKIIISQFTVVCVCRGSLDLSGL